ncbi:MAG TPA: DUF1302 family protein, partial [Noviherbaspirillum sp.]|nr:DUF1302 family protein [Noviherbaspirillum sp.]
MQTKKGCKDKGLTPTGVLSKSVVASLCCIAASGNAWAFELQGESDVKVRWDNTLKYSVLSRVNDPSPGLLSSPNLDDGDRNFKKGVVSNRVDWLTELDVSRGNMGARVSAAAWYDSVYRQGTDHDSPGTSNNV